MMNQTVNSDAEREEKEKSASSNTAISAKFDDSVKANAIHTGQGNINITTVDADNNRQKEFPLGDVEVRYRCFGFKVTGLNATFAIAGTVYLGSMALNGVLSLVQAYCEHVLFKVDHGSYIIHVFTKDAQSKQELLEQVTSKALEKKLEDIFDKKVEVHLVEVGAVIATEEEFAQLKKHMEKKLKKIQFKIDNNCKGTIEDFCCTMPIFQNKSRFLMHEVTRDTENDIIECLKTNLEFVKPDEESLLQTAHEKNNAKVKQQGFLVQHPGFSKFSETFQSHPGLQEMVVEVIDTVEELVKQNLVMIPQVEAEKLLEFNPILFTGNCEMALRKLAKFAKTFMFEKDFEITKSLLVWMIKLCNNIMDDERIGRLLLLSFFKLIEVFLDFVSKSDQHLRGTDYALELYGETKRCAETNIKDDLLTDMMRYIFFVERSSDRFDFSNWNLRLHCITRAMTEQSGKNDFKLVHYHLKRLLLMTRNYDFEKSRRAIYDFAIRDLLKVAERVVEFSHSQCVRMVVEIFERLRSQLHLTNDPLFDYLLTHIHRHQILLHSFNTIHEILESRKKSQCGNSSIFALLITIYKLLLLWNDRSAEPLPVTELSSCVLRLCYYHTPDNGKSPHELSVSEIFDSESKLLKQVTENNKAANKFMIYENNSSKFDKVSDTSDCFTQTVFPRRNVDRHRSLRILSRWRKILEMLSVTYNSAHASGTGTVSSGYGSEQDIVSSGYGSEQSTRSSGYLSGQGPVPSGYRSKQNAVPSLPPRPLSPMQRLRNATRRRSSGQHTSPPPSPPPTKK